MESIKQKNMVLVATDFTHVGDNAIDYAAKMVNHFHGKIVLLHVINKVTRKKLKKESKGIDYLHSKLKEEAEKVRQISGLEASYIVREGSIFTTIGDVARETGAMYLVIGTHGKVGIQQLLGSFILRVIKRTPVPVFAIQTAIDAPGFKKIVYPLDTSIGSKQKIKWAIHFNNLIGARFHIFVENPVIAELKNKLTADLKFITKIMDQNGLAFSVAHAQGKGSFASQVVGYAKDQQADFIMVSTDPEKITWAVSRSDDEQLIYNKEKIPVMCINSKEVNLIIGGL